MSIKLGNADINKLYLNNIEIDKLYLGGNLIFENNVSSELFDFNNAAADPNGTEADSIEGFIAIGGVSIFSESIDPQSGNYHITIQSDDTGGSGDRAQIEVPIEIGEQYRISIWAKEALGSDGRVQLFSGVSGWGTVVLTDTWTEYEQIVTATSSTMVMRFYPNMGSGNPGDQIYLDNISVTKIDSELYTLENVLSTTNESNLLTGINNVTAFIESVASPVQNGQYALRIHSGLGGRGETTFETVSGQSYEISYWAWAGTGSAGQTRTWSNLSGSFVQTLNETPTLYTVVVSADSDGTATLRWYLDSGTEIFVDGLSIKEL